MTDKHILLDCSDKERVFVAGDVHGEYDMLMERLEHHKFNTEKDILLLVGDVADRGPDSKKMLDYIDNPWVNPVMGNHEQAPRLYLDKYLPKKDMDAMFGTAWFTDLPEEEIEAIAVRMEALPIAMTVITPGGRRVGIVHADCLRDWNYHIKSLHVPAVEQKSLWDRETINTLMEMQQAGETLHPEAADVYNIDHVFHGHTPLAVPLTVGNRSWIDTGACFGGVLTVVDCDQWISHWSNKR